MSDYKEQCIAAKIVQRTMPARPVPIGKKKAKKKFPLEARRTFQFYWETEAPDWEVWGWYATERDREKALEGLNKSRSSHREFRIPA